MAMSFPSPLLNDDDLAELERIGNRAHFGAKTLIVSRGDSSDFVLIIDQGWIKAVRRVSSDKKQPEPPRIVALHGPGDVSGEVASATGRPRIADLVALTDIDGTKIPGPEWLNFLKSRPDTLMRVYQRSEMIRAQQTSLRTESASRSEFKVSNALVDLVETGLGVPNDDIEPPRPEAPKPVTFTGFTQVDIAGLSGVSRESTVLSIKDLRERNIMRTGRERFTIVDIEQLYRLADRTYPPDRPWRSNMLTLLDTVLPVITIMAIAVTPMWKFAAQVANRWIDRLDRKDTIKTYFDVMNTVGPERASDVLDKLTGTSIATPRDTPIDKNDPIRGDLDAGADPAPLDSGTSGPETAER